MSSSVVCVEGKKIRDVLRGERCVCWIDLAALSSSSGLSVMVDDDGFDGRFTHLFLTSSLHSLHQANQILKIQNFAPEKNHLQD